MKTLLKNNKLVPPVSIEEGRRRLEVLSQEIERIRIQIEDPCRALTADSSKEYSDWKRRASIARNLFLREEEQLLAWVKTQEGKVEELLKDAFTLLQTLADEVDFSPGEFKVLDRITNHFHGA